MKNIKYQGPIKKGGLIKLFNFYNEHKKKFYHQRNHESSLFFSLMDRLEFKDYGVWSFVDEGLFCGRVWSGITLSGEFISSI